jgi:transposase-like protein
MIKSDECPRCSSNNIEGESLYDYSSSQDGELEQEYHCVDCEAAWVNRYKLISRRLYQNEEPSR